MSIQIVWMDQDEDEDEYEDEYEDEDERVTEDEE